MRTAAQIFFLGMLLFGGRIPFFDRSRHGGGDAFRTAIVQLGDDFAQLAQAFFFVQILAPLLLTGNDKACRQVGEPDGAVSGIDMLAAAAASAEGGKFAFRHQVGI